MPPLTVVISTKDEPEAFRLVSRICEQAQSEDEIIILDDYSHETFTAALRFYAAVYPFLRVISHELNDDFSAHRNFVHRFIRLGRWMVLLDADEWVSKSFLSAIREKIQANPSVDVFALARINTLHNGDQWSQPEIDWNNLRSGRYQNYPDFQRRVHIRSDKIRWVNRMHNVLAGGMRIMTLEGPDLSLYHHKALYKTERMHAMYARIQSQQND